MRVRMIQYQVAYTRARFNVEHTAITEMLDIDVFKSCYSQRE